MEIEGTREAFASMIQERGIFKRLGVDRSTVATWKIYLRDGKNISLEKMEEILIKGGASVKQEKIWEVNVYEDIAMKEFQVQLKNAVIGSIIEVNWDVLSEMIVKPLLLKRAEFLGCKVTLNKIQSPFVTYSFEKRT